MTQLTFDEEYRCEDDEEGIPISVILTYGDKSIRTDAKVDPGSAVCLFAKYPGLPRNLLGRRGWLRNLRLGLIDYDNLLYLSAYDS